MRNLKVLVLSVASICAMGALLAHGAAASPTITVTNGSTIEAVDTGSIKFTLTGQTGVCKQAIFRATAPANSFTQLTVRPTFNECNFAGFSATVTGFGQHGETSTCDLFLRSTGTNDLVCPAGRDVTIDAATCIVHIPGQNSLGTITYTTDNSGIAKALELHINVTDITTTHTDGFLCPFSGTGEGNNGILEGSITATAVSSGFPIPTDLTDH